MTLLPPFLELVVCCDAPKPSTITGQRCTNGSWGARWSLCPHVSFHCCDKARVFSGEGVILELRVVPGVEPIMQQNSRLLQITTASSRSHLDSVPNTRYNSSSPKDNSITQHPKTATKSAPVDKCEKQRRRKPEHFHSSPGTAQVASSTASNEYDLE